MLNNILKLLPILIPLLKKLIELFTENKKTQPEVELSQETINDLVKKAEEKVTKIVEETIETYRPVIRTVSNSLPTQTELEREAYLDELEKKLFQNNPERLEELKRKFL
jgi:formiminotetrahydrofolate cyclodeaminase